MDIIPNSSMNSQKTLQNRRFAANLDELNMKCAEQKELSDQWTGLIEKTYEEQRDSITQSGDGLTYIRTGDRRLLIQVKHDIRKLVNDIIERGFINDVFVLSAGENREGGIEHCVLTDLGTRKDEYKSSGVIVGVNYIERLVEAYKA